MQDQREAERAKIDGRAAFAAAAYLIGAGLIFLLERVGAPDALVRALGPLSALAALALLGLLTRSTRVPTFFTADRAIPPPYAGLAFAAVVAGFFLCLDPASASPLPLVGVAIGLCAGALIVGPLLRSTNASALSDLLATRFPNPALTLFFAGALFAVGVIVAAVGFEAATDALIALFAPSRAAASMTIAIILGLMIAPGGLAGLLWSGAASAGILLITLYLPIAAHFFVGEVTVDSLSNGAGLWSDVLARAWGHGADSKTHLLAILASALAIATLPPFTAPAIASFKQGHALRAGGFGLILAALIGLAALVDVGLWPSSTAPMSNGLKSAAILLAALMLSAAGVHAASRAWGTNAGGAYGRYMPLASQRLARSRALMFVVIALCAGVTQRFAFDPKLALVVAAALSLVITAPVLALALSSRATSAHAIASVLTSLATVILLGALERRVPDAERLLIGALSAAAAGFIVAWSAAIFARDDQETNPARRDLFVDAPLDPGG